MQRRDLESGEEPQDKSTAIVKNQRLNLAAMMIDALDIAVIFAFFLKEHWHEILEKSARNYLFPIAAAATGAQAGFAWRHVYLEGEFKTGSVVKASVDTLVALAVVFAVIGGLSGLLLPIVPPAIFATTFGLKALFSGGTSVFNFGKSSAALEQNDIDRFKTRAINFGVSTLIGALLTTAIITVMIFKLSEFAALGIAGASAGALAGGYHLARSFKKKDAEETPLLIESSAPAAEPKPADTVRHVRIVAPQPAPAATPKHAVVGHVVSQEKRDPRRSMPVTHVEMQALASIGTFRKPAANHALAHETLKPAAARAVKK